MQRIEREHAFTADCMRNSHHDVNDLVVFLHGGTALEANHEQTGTHDPWGIAVKPVPIQQLVGDANIVCKVDGNRVASHSVALQPQVLRERNKRRGQLPRFQPDSPEHAALHSASGRGNDARYTHNDPLQVRQPLRSARQACR
eukprot:scaffold8082_cov258-Pinguiococcus_pyrenoidosus.AAC.3